MRPIEISRPPPARASRHAPAPARFALLNLGFRPFYLLAALLAALAVPLWAAQYAGWLHAPALGMAWHAHEMLFGFTMAVIAGFLFTAVRNWTNLPTPTGARLAAIAALWLAGRVLVLTPYSTAAALANAAFPLAVAAGIGVPIVRSGNRRNLFFVGLMGAIAVATLAVHGALPGVAALPARLGLQVALDVVLFIMAVMAGRVVPMFTNNGVPGAGATRHALVEHAALGGTLALLAADAAGLPAGVLGVVAAACALAHAARLALWRPWKTRPAPLVWILHAAYAWIPVHLLLRALAAAGAVPEPIAVHALTIGAIGGLTIGMMTRTARGHTGRALQADRWETACYLLVQAAALVRVFGPLALPAAYAGLVAASSLLWSAAFALYAVRYWPVLTRPRVDGKPG